MKKFSPLSSLMCAVAILSAFKLSKNELEIIDNVIADLEAQADTLYNKSQENKIRKQKSASSPVRKKSIFRVRISISRVSSNSETRRYNRNIWLKGSESKQRAMWLGS